MAGQLRTSPDTAGQERTPPAQIRAPRTTPHFSPQNKERITLDVSRDAELNEKFGPSVECRLTQTEYRDFKKLSRKIGQSQLLRLLISQAITKAKNGGLQIDLTL
jgi:hypothetical protein